MAIDEDTQEVIDLLRKLADRLEADAMRPKPTHKCENCGTTDRTCTRNVLRKGKACCTTCYREDTHGYDGRLLHEVWTEDEIAALKGGC